MKQNYKDMLLESASGYMMPFPLEEKDNIQATLAFGEQNHPLTGEKFFHKGIDFPASDKSLYAIATGIIIGAGQDAVYDNYIVAKYGKYEITYGHIAEAYTPYGTQVVAGQEIAKSGRFLHIGVRFDGAEIDPAEFLSMIWANIEQLAAMGISQLPSMETLGDKKVENSFEQDKDALLMMMLRWLPSYWNDLVSGAYTSSKRADMSLRNIFRQAAEKNYFFESMPSIGNPLGLSGRSSILAGKVQDVLIDDFLSYMALNHNIYLPTWDETQKKKLFDEIANDGKTIDPLLDLQIDVQSYDIDREASVYFDNSGTRCWTKAWFNGREKGEKAIEITRQLALKFIEDQIGLNEWLSRYYPKQMSVYYKAIEQARQQILGF